MLPAFRFAVFFFASGALPNPVDTRFQKVSGLAATVDTKTQSAGGQNLYTQKLPTGVSHGNLVLSRGMVVGSPLNVDFGVALSLFRFSPANVMVTLLDEKGEPVPGAAWLFMNAWPAKWSTSDLDATATTGLVIDTLELAYSRMQPMRF